MGVKNTDPTPAPPLQGRGKKQPLITKGGSVETRMKSLRIMAHFPAPLCSPRPFMFPSPLGEGLGVRLRGEALGTGVGSAI